MILLHVSFSLFYRFGVKEIKIKTNLVVVSLTYSPKDSTLKKKFGNLPVAYCRVIVDNEEELSLFEHCVKKYNFDLSDSDTPTIEELEEAPLPRSARLHILKFRRTSPTKASKNSVPPAPPSSPKIGIVRRRREKSPSSIVAEKGSPTTPEQRMQGLDDEDLGMESQAFF